MTDELERRGMATNTQRDWLKWVRYFLDFCGKYGHPPREEESLGPFLRKLATKGQSGSRQDQAGESVRFFYEVVKRFPPPGGRREREEPEAERVAEGRDGWPGCFERLTGVMKVRMMGHSDVSTTMIYTQTVPSRTLKNRRSPLDIEPGAEERSREGES